VISFFGALACAELGTALPSTGGQYVFLREAYGPLVGFLCGWSACSSIIGTALLWSSKAASPAEGVAGGFSLSSFGVALIAFLPPGSRHYTPRLSRGVRP
jgi:amino acid transporter